MVFSFTAALQGLLLSQVQQDVEFFIALAWHSQQVERSDDDTKNREVDTKVENHCRCLLRAEDVDVQRRKERAFDETGQARQRREGHDSGERREKWTQ